jgi:hypothetical protein
MSIESLNKNNFYGTHFLCSEASLHSSLLAGGFYHDIQATALISKPSFFCLLWHTMDAINYSESLDINTPRFGNKLNV